MEKTSDYVGVLSSASNGRLYVLVRSYRTTVELNRYLDTRTYFQFPVVTGNSVQDIVSYYMDMIALDQPDETDTQLLYLGKYIHAGFVLRGSTLYSSAAYDLLEERSTGAELKPTSKYIMHLLRLAYEHGPWTMRRYYDMTAMQRPEKVYALFVDLGITDGLVYCTAIHLPDRAQMIERMTDKAAQDNEYYTWLLRTGPSITREELGREFRLHNLCAILSLAKVIKYSSSEKEFKKKLLAMLNNRYSGKTGEKVRLVFGDVMWACTADPTKNDGIDFTRYLQYMVKALTYTELVTDVSLVSTLGKVSERQERVLKMLADTSVH